MMKQTSEQTSKHVTPGFFAEHGVSEVLASPPLLSVLLDGFALRVGMLFPFAPDEKARRHIPSSISPVWDGDETWLAVVAATLFGAFPLVHATVIPAFLPALLMPAALILRGAAFGYRAVPRLARTAP